MTKQDLKNQLENVSTIYVVGITKGTNPNWDKGIWRTFRLFYMSDDEGYTGNKKLEKVILRSIIIDENEAKECSNWNNRKRVFESKGLGTDRTFEIVYNFSSWLFGDGYKLHPLFLNY